MRLLRGVLLLAVSVRGFSSAAPHSTDSTALVQTTPVQGPSVAVVKQAKPAKKRRKRRRAVWVHSIFPRSGSSTVLSMVDASVHPQQRLGGSLFALFEPCHGKDRLSVKLRAGGCLALLHNILLCQFKDVLGLWGWDNPHSVHLGVWRFVPHLAAQACRKADLTTFKTLGEPLGQESLQLLRKHKHLQVVDVVRDPRSIISSWRSTPGMNVSAVLPSGAQGLLTICREYAKGLARSEGLTLAHARLHRVVFEDLIRRPEAEVKRIYGSLGLEFNVVQRIWLRHTFSAKNCTFVGPYTDCRTDSNERIEDWRYTLPLEEQAAFAADPQCQKVAKEYGWPKA